MYNYVTSYIKGKNMKCFKILMMFYVVLGIIKILNNPVNPDINIIQKANYTFSSYAHKL